MTDAVKMRMVIPFQFEKLTKYYPTNLVGVWPFSETNVAATRVAREAGQIREILSSGPQLGNRELAGIFCKGDIGVATVEVRLSNFNGVSRVKGLFSAKTF
jgi:hypothetical protein